MDSTTTLDITLAAAALLVLWALYLTRRFYPLITQLRKYQPRLSLISTWSLILWTSIVCMYQVIHHLPLLVLVVAIWCPAALMHCLMIRKALMYHYAFVNAENVINGDTGTQEEIGRWSQFVLHWFGTVYSLLPFILLEILYLLVDLHWWFVNDHDSSQVGRLLCLRKSIWMILRLTSICVLSSTVVLLQHRIRSTSNLWSQLSQFSAFLGIMIILQLFISIYGMYFGDFVLSLAIFSILLTSGWIVLILWKPLVLLDKHCSIAAERKYVHDSFGRNLEILDFMHGEGFFLLMQFCRNEYSVENLRFFKDVYVFKMECSQSLGYHKLFALTIYRKYIHDDAPYMINLPSHVRNSIVSSFNDGKIPVKDPKVFDDAAQCVLRLLIADTYHRFQLTDEYRIYKAKKSRNRILKEQLILV